MAERHTDSSTVALARVESLHLGAAQFIIGARTLEQLGKNLKAVDFTLTPEQIATSATFRNPRWFPGGYAGSFA